MGRHPYDRLRIIYAKQKDWNSAIRVCQKLIAAVKSGNNQFIHPSFKITMKKYEEWIKKYKRKLGIGTVSDSHSSDWILAQSITNYFKQNHNSRRNYLPVFNFNDCLPLWAREEISFISTDVPPLVHQFPSFEIMNEINRTYFNCWLSHWQNEKPLEINGYVSYLFVYIYSIIENSIPRARPLRSNKNYDYFRELLLLQHVYQNEKFLCNYLLTWIFDAYIYNHKDLTAVSYVEYQRNYNGLHLKFKDSNHLVLNIKYNNKLSMSGEDVFQLSNRKRNDIISENEEYVIHYLDNKITDLEKEKGIDLLSLITEQYAVFVSSYNYSAFRDTPHSPYVLEIADYYDYSELSEFDRVINDWINEAENVVREKMGLPRIGEGWVSETVLYNKICEIFKNEKYDILFHAHPPFLKGLELDIYIPVLKLGIEYQGKQHYEPIDFFGGTQGFNEQKKRDLIKKELCDQHGISMAYFRYDESIDEKNIINKIKTVVNASLESNTSG